MADTRANIVISAEDRTRAAFASAQGALQRLDRQAQTLAGGFGTLGRALGVVFAGKLVGDMLSAVDALNDVSDATGATVENISALKNIADRTGGSIEGVESILIRFNAALTKAGEDDGAAQVLKAIGLSAEELRRLDPAEALRQTAVALSRFANDGDKARAIQVLFGKSVKDAAPFLKDLAEAGGLNATVTSKQADEAEKFNRSLADLRVNLENAARTIVASAVPAVTQLVQAMNAGVGDLGARIDAAARALGGLGALYKTSISEVLKGNTFSSAQQGLEFYNAKLKEVDATLRAIEAGQQSPTSIYGADRLENLRAQREEFSKLTDLYRQMLTLGTAGGGRGSVTPLTVPPPVQLPSLGAVATAGADKKKAATQAAVISEFEKYKQRLEEVFTASQNLSTEEQARLDMSLDRLGPLNEAQREQILLLARAVDLARAQQAEAPPGELMLPGAREMEERMERLGRLLGATNAARAARLRQDIQLLGDAMEDGAGPADQLGEALKGAMAELDAMGREAQQTAQEVDRFAEQFQGSIQDAFADTLFRSATDGFDDIADAWGRMLLRMAAEAAAADLTRALFGNAQGGGSADFISAIGSLFGATAAPTGAAAAGGGGGISASAGQGLNLVQSAPRSAGPTIVYQVAAGVQRNELLQALQTVEQRQAATLNKRLAAAGI